MAERNPELIAGRYQLVEHIGQGGMGRVRRRLDQHLFGREIVLVMELVRGQSLDAAIRDGRRLPVHRVAEIGAAMLDALAEAHRARIVHRDIEPDNGCWPRIASS
ncbi:hypothetical protein [Streptomyces sp. NPDC059389]|uniref:protein kinase domain-containing protein n=1 Tax=Streptomyces sp. NPDC059389 TaxID=3346818 RepID=UPI0036A20948